MGDLYREKDKGGNKLRWEEKKMRKGSNQGAGASDRMIMWDSRTSKSDSTQKTGDSNYNHQTFKCAYQGCRLVEEGGKLTLVGKLVLEHLMSKICNYV